MKASRFQAVDGTTQANPVTKGLERDLDKYADKRIKELYRQTLNAAKGLNKDSSKAGGNKAMVTRKTTSEKHLDFDSQTNFRQTDNFEILRKFVGVDSSKEVVQPPSSTHQKILLRHQRTCKPTSADFI